MSVIYYKFKSAKDSDYDVYTFDGPGATVADLKGEIIRAKKMDKGTDFDIAIYNAQTDEEYKDDMFMVPRNTSIIVRRLPASRPGKGTAQRYVLGALENKGPGTVKSSPAISTPSFSQGHRNMVLNNTQHHQPQPMQTDTEDVNKDAIKDDSEEARIQAMFQQTTDQWGVMQEKLAEQQYIPYNARGGGDPSKRGKYQGPASTGENKEAQMPQRIPPANYVCYRCGQKGHYINQCPTNGDKEYDKHPRIKRTTGIPRSFLKVIEEPKTAVKAGTGGLMVTPKGDIVVAQADSSTWDKHVAKAATTLGLGSSSAGDLMDWYDTIPIPDHLKCTICEGLLRDASITPCCGASFCDDCIRVHMMDHDFACADCEEHIQNGLDGLIANVDVRECVDNYVRKFANN
ncbi:DWNN domain-containing protein [Sporodiniella umbellata]|nr:DWNN domain-containing protein [Sporodiniella umbellata]